VARLAAAVALWRPAGGAVGAPAARLPTELAAGLARAARPRLVAAVEVGRRALAVLARARAADEDAPTIPCALRRCAPSAAARANDLLHSGQMNPPDLCFAALRVRALGLLALRARGLGLLALRARGLGLLALRLRGLGLLALRLRGLGLLALRVRGLMSPILLTKQLRKLRMPAYAGVGLSAP
jgi:hypothetical protein